MTLPVVDEPVSTGGTEGPLLRLADEAATQGFAADLAIVLRTGDVVLLVGDLGAGKTTLARALVRFLAADPELEVPSPTYTLVQAYETRPKVTHFDLYRLGAEVDLVELGFEEAAETGIVLCEWPERAGFADSDANLRILLDFDPAGGRTARLLPDPEIAVRIERSLKARAFLAAAGHGEAERRPLTGDASVRRYETIRSTGTHLVLMDAPPMPPAKPVRDGLSYARIAHIAETILPFVAIGERLAALGFSAPRILAADIDNGFALLEDLGPEGILDEHGRPIPERYEAVALSLADLHRRPFEAHLTTRDGRSYTVPRFDRDALLIEVELLLDWYRPRLAGRPVHDGERAAFLAAWNRIFDELDEAETGLLLRDVHSPNILWQEDRQGHARVGLLDFQDAMIGPVAYDLASLAQDARVDIPPELEARLVSAYVAARQGEPGFDAFAFERAYAIMAAQRATKILGIFVRLHERDGKPQYLRHIPRLKTYLKRTLGHPSLAELERLYESWGLLGEDEAVSFRIRNMTDTGSRKPTTAMVLAAGLGKRMRPITTAIPKPLVEVRGKALIDYGLDALARNGVQRAVVNVHYLPDLMRAHLRRRRDLEILVSDETDQLLESGGAVVRALPLLGAEPFFLINSDTFWIDGYRDNLDLLAEFWDPAEMDALLLIADMRQATGYDGRGDFLMDSEGRLTRVAERDMSPFIYAGAAILKPELFAGLAEEKFSLNRIFDAVIDTERLSGVRLDGLWITVGTPAAIAEADAAFLASAAA